MKRKNEIIWALEYSPIYKQTHVNTLGEIMERKIDEEWIIISFHKTIDDACSTGDAFEKYVDRDKPMFESNPGFIRAFNRKKIEHHLRDESMKLAELLKGRPSTEALESLILIQKYKIDAPALKLVDDSQ